MTQRPEDRYRQSVRDRMARAYGPHAAENGEASAAPPALELEPIQRAIAELRAAGETIGELPPQPPSLRGRVGLRLVRLIQRALFWYTPRLLHVQQINVRAHEEQEKTIAALVEELRRIEAWKQEMQSPEQETRARLAAMERQLSELRKAVLPDPEAARRVDDFCAAVAEEFRGSPESIKARLSVYLPVLDAVAGPDASFLDIGCGRGEWLELLRDRGWDPLGIDQSPTMVDRCGRRGLRVIREEALGYLKSLESGSLDAVTAFHLIEHLPLPALLELLTEIHRVLKPTGIAILETPNPRNLFMGARYFYLDPTHRNPIPAELGRLLVRTQGFEEVEIMELNPWPESHHVKASGEAELAGRFNELFYGPQDYGIVAWKTARGQANPGAEA